MYKSTTSIRKKPKNLCVDNEDLFSSEYKKSIKEPGYVLKKNIYVQNLQLRKYVWLKYYSKYWRINQYSFIENVKNLTFGISNYFLNKNIKYLHIENASWILNHRSNQYFHWMTDALQRLEVIKHKSELYPIIIFDYLLDFEFIWSTLDKLQVNYIVLSKDKFYKIDNLLIAEPVADSGNFHPEILNTIRKNLRLKSINSKVEKKIWISRQSASKRKIVNFDEIKKILINNSFEIIEFENLKFLDQIKILSNCVVLGGLHGAGLLNMLFIKNQSKIIEIRGKEDRVNNCFFSMSSDLNHDYYYFLADNDNQNYYSGNYYINPSKFDNFLKSF